METDRQPSPDALLERIQEEERKAQRGKLTRRAAGQRAAFELALDELR